MSNYSDIIKALENSTGFDLFRLSVAIGRLLEDPKRITEVKEHLHPGDEVEYFDRTQNRVVAAKLLEFRRTRVLIQHLEDGSEWTIPYYWLNIHRANVEINENRKKGLGRNEVAVGDQVGFVDNDGNERYGKVVRLNQKTVTLDCGNNHQWRVAYSFLFRVFDVDGDQVIDVPARVFDVNGDSVIDVPARQLPG
jgi:hypothetical protein